MSPDAAFSPVNFPTIPGHRDDERASIRGHAAGYAAGRRQVEEELEAVRRAIAEDGTRQLEQHRREVEQALAALARSAAEFRARELPVLEAIETAIAAAAIELAEAIVGHELSAADGSARAVVERAVQVGAGDASAIRLNPDDLAVITSDGDFRHPIELVADPALHRGDAIVETGNGSIDARISAAVTRAKTALRGGAA